MNDKLGKFDEVYNKIRKEQGIDTAKKPTQPTQSKEKPKDTKKPEQKQTTPPKNK